MIYYYHLTGKYHLSNMRNYIKYRSVESENSDDYTEMTSYVDVLTLAVILTGLITMRVEN